MALKSTLQTTTPSNSQPSHQWDRLGALLREQRELTEQIEDLETRLPALQEAVRAVSDPLLAEIRANRLALVALVERHLVRLAGRRGVLHDGLDLLFRMATELEDRFGEDLRARAVRWDSLATGAGGTVLEDEEESEDADTSWLAQTLSRAQQAVPKANPKAPAFSEEKGREAYLQLARELHPDKVQDPQKQAERTAQMQELTEAWQARNLTRILELLHAWGSARAQQGVWQGQDLSKFEQSLREEVRQLQIRFRNLRDPGDGADWWVLSEDPKAFARHIEQVRRSHREELLFLSQCKSAWLTSLGLETWLARAQR